MTKVWFLANGDEHEASVKDFDQTMRDWRRGMNLTMYRGTLEFEVRGMSVIAIGLA